MPLMSLPRISSTYRILNFKRCLVGTIFSSFAAATYYRPLPNDEVSKNIECSKTQRNNIDRAMTPFCSKISYSDMSREETPFLVSIARAFSIGITTIAIRIFMTTYGTYEIVDPFQMEYSHFISLVLGRKKGESLLTVSNHRSVFDDPGVVSCLLPLWIGLQPKYNRWGICSQEYCFNDRLPAFIKGYIGAGQVVPIYRGGGINQKLLENFAKLLARGEWCHIFPEGGVFQLNELGGRHQKHKMYQENPYNEANENNLDSIGKLKWGVGKLIAHAPIRPRVIPFAHIGMDVLLPKDQMIRIFGGKPLKVKIKFGKELFFDDLIQEHEKKHGKLWKYESNRGGNSIDKDQLAHDNDYWNSSKKEKELYKKITMRVEKELELLTSKLIRS